VSAAGGSISLLLGTVLLRLSITGLHQRYVRVGMGPWLAVAGVVVIVLGVVTLERTLPGRHSQAGHGHSHLPRVGFLLLAPVVVLLLVAPPALGSYGVDRGAVVDVTAGAPAFEALDPAAGPVDMSLTEFSQRAFDHDGETFAGATVRLTGFVADEADPFRLARYQIACCAVDAAPVVVRVTGAVGDPPERDRWVTVVGTFDSVTDDDIPTLAVTSIVDIPPPDDPYE
jgi:uncharacterized repeat protein (TIGR03943 family)